MCQLLAMNCATPTDIRFSFAGFCERGGNTADHADGFGIAFFEDKACRLFVDTQPAVQSPIAELIRNYAIKSRNVIAHIRKATQGATTLENAHPFMRELWGRHWIFAHNGDLKAYAPALSGCFQPVGTTDSELAFCALLQGMRDEFGAQEPAPEALFAFLAQMGQRIAQYGTFNFVLSNGHSLYAFATTHLHYLVRQWPFASATLRDVEMSIDFGQLTTAEDRVAVIATEPLTVDEQWTAFEPGRLLRFQAGQVVDSTRVVVPIRTQDEKCGKGLAPMPAQTD